MTKEAKIKIILDACEKLELVGKGFATADRLPDDDPKKKISLDIFKDVKEQAKNDILAVLDLKEIEEACTWPRLSNY